ncbi:MAG: tetratricopeptide repeat protein [Anaerolineae bacterium]|nr:tetratricopeptide repeat protein [Anaerolineae bacterium]
MPTYDAFLSYARGDDARADGTPADYNDPADSFIRRLYDALTAAGLSIWWDRQCLPARALSFNQEIRDAINASARLLLVVGPHSALGGLDAAGKPFEPSAYVQKEIEHARTACIAINPILRKGDYDQLRDLRPDLSAGDVPDFTDDAHFKRSVDQLVRQLKEDVAPMGALHGVPLLPTYYIERKDALKELEAKIHSDADQITVISAMGRPRTPDEQAVAVQGMGGIGKSTLAAALALDCDVRRMFPDGIYWVELKRDPSIALRQADLGARFGDTDVNEYPDAVRGKQRLGALLEDKRALIILDDIWKKEHADAFLVPAPRCCFLLTTRLQALVDDLDLRAGSEVRLNTLTDQEAIRLIEARLGAAAPDQHETFTAIHALLEGHTLALSLAAARIAKKGAAYAPDYLATLQQRLSSDRPFFELDKLEATEKNLSVSVTLQESYEALSEANQRRFRLLGIFAPDGTFDAPAAAAVWDEPVEDTPEYLQFLVDAALLNVAEGGSYDQHALLRAHARARMNAEERAAAFARYADYVIAVAEQFRQLRQDAWGKLDPELPHIHAVGDALVTQFHASQPDDAALRERCGRFSWNTMRYLNYRLQAAFTDQDGQRLPTRLAWMEMGRTHWDESGNQEREATTLNNIGGAWSALGENRKALEFYEQAVSLFRGMGDRGGEAATLTNIGAAWNALGEKHKALDFYEQALPLRRAVGDRGGEATTLTNIGAAWDALGEKHKALDFYEQALPLQRAVGDRGGEAIALNNIGSAWDALGEKHKALDFYEQAASLFRGMGDRGGEALALNNIGLACSALGENRKALEFYEQALPLQRAVGDRGGEATTLNNIGAAWDALGEKRQALEFYEQALPLYRAVGDRGGEATTLNNIGSAWDALGEKRKALDFYEQALPLRRAVGDRGGEATTLNNIGGAWDDLGEKRKALAFYEQALPLRRAVGDRVGEAATLNNMAGIHYQNGEYAQAAGIFRQIIPIMAAIGAVAEEAVITFNLAVVLSRALGQRDEAISLVERAIALLKSKGLDRDASGATLEQYRAFLAALENLTP